MNVDGAPGVPAEAGVEDARRILQGRSLRERHLHDVLVGLARADDSVVQPARERPRPPTGGLSVPTLPATGRRRARCASLLALLTLSVQLVSLLRHTGAEVLVRGLEGSGILHLVAAAGLRGADRVLVLPVGLRLVLLGVGRNALSDR